MSPIPRACWINSGSRISIHAGVRLLAGGLGPSWKTRWARWADAMPLGHCGKAKQSGVKFVTAALGRLAIPRRPALTALVAEEREEPSAAIAAGSTASAEQIIDEVPVAPFVMMLAYGDAALRFAAHEDDEIGVLADFIARAFIGDDQRCAWQKHFGDALLRLIR